MTTPVVMHVEGVGEVWAYRTPETHLTIAASRIGISFWFDNQDDEPVMDEDPADDYADHSEGMGGFTCRCHWCVAYRKHLELKR